MLDVDTYRYRVVHVLSVGEDFVYEGEVQEFKTLDGANACEKRWREKGWSVLLQTGRLHWMNAEEHDAHVSSLPAGPCLHVGPGWKQEESRCDTCAARRERQRQVHAG